MNLTKEQIKLFGYLHNSRAEDYKVFSKKDYGGLFRSVIEKYPESAHFIYELLQNADDANASEVYVILKQDRLIFKHNGTKHFDVTPLDAERTGDVNSITGIGNSSKTGETTDTQNKIGKFGVGFKSVFQYTETPEIYDETYCFKIENYIIPTLLEYDHPDRRPGETLFVFRFPKEKNKKAYDEIKNRLTNLQNPILFLQHLKKIIWRIDLSEDEKGQELSYEKKQIDIQESPDQDITFEHYLLIEPKKKSNIFLFSRGIVVTDNEKKSNHRIYIGFFYDAEKKKLITSDCSRNIYCFFPTDESFDTCFISHAPFLLTDNRQNLKRDENLNKDLIRLLANLAADSIVWLRDYGIDSNNLLIDGNLTEIIPEYESRYNYYYDDEDEDDEESKESFFQDSIISAFKKMLDNEPLFLSRSGKYLLPKNAYSTHNGIYDLLSTEQLNELLESSSADFMVWELAQGIDKFSDNYSFFEDIQYFSIEDFGRSITANFMNAQKFEWVTKFYTFLREHAAVHINISSQSKDLVFRSAPIIKTQTNEWVAPFIKKTTPNVYLPIQGKTDKSSGYNFVNNQYLNDPLAMKLFTMLELKKPDEYDYIRNIILKKYTAEDVEIEDDVLRADFEVLLDYYQRVQHTDKEDEFVNMVKNSILLVGKNETLYKPNQLFLETPVLAQYFEGYDKIVFFDLFYYRKHIHTFKTSYITDFVCLLGLQTKPQVTFDVSFSSYSLPKHIKQYVDSLSYYEFVKLSDPKLQGFVNACSSHHITKELSVYLWNEIICDYTNQKSAEIYTRQKHKQYSNVHYCQSTFLHNLLNNEWIYDKDGQLRIATELHIEDLAPEYNLANGIIDFLGITKAVENISEKYGATEEEQKVFDFGAKAIAAGKGLTEEEKLAVLEDAAKKKAAAEAAAQRASTQPQASAEPKPTLEPEQPHETIEDKFQKRIDEKKNRHVGKPHSSTNNGDLEACVNNSPEQLSPENDAPFFVDPHEPVNTPTQEAEDTARAEKNLKAKNTLAQEQAEVSGEQVEYLELLNQTPKFTFKWFQILMLLMHQGQDKLTKRTVQIDFAHYELQCSDKILHLSEPNIPVPAWGCDAEKYVVSAIADGKSNKLDGLIVKTEDNSLDLSIEVNAKMKFFLQQAKKIRVIAEDNTNIIDSLETRFLQLEKEPDFDMNANLPTNISFIYGPPGTGKTTELVRQVHDILEKEPEAKILVLTPTNKAADVVAIKMANDEVCEGGLARFGATESLYLIEEIGCVTNRDTTDLKDWHNIVVATAARYAYDYVQPDDTPICDYPWDYIFIDEASMIDILTITYILHKGASAKKLIVSGDPMQIQPVVQNDMPDYNIYDMVNLHGFSNAIFDYDRFDVQGLTMQHRSIPVIGDLVSNFAYDGLVDADPNRAPMKPLKLDGLNIKNINFVGFDVAELDDIKGLNAVNNSAFNLYSVIFTYNMIEYTIKQIEKHYPQKDYTIGVVCAYRAQSDAIKNMLENRPLDTDYCKVSCGTVHSFQGDECDIMFIVLNPPAVCTSGTHVNNTNIINVAMSRARDYIFFVMPNGQQKGFFMKNKIGHQLANIFDRAILKSSDVERVMFQGNDNFIYENTHVTCHMPVNVYCEDNALYEVRMSDDALDIKINQNLLKPK